MGGNGNGKDSWKNWGQNQYQNQYGPQRNNYQQNRNNQYGSTGMFGGMATQFSNFLGDVTALGQMCQLGSVLATSQQVAQSSGQQPGAVQATSPLLPTGPLGSLGAVAQPAGTTQVLQS